MRDPRHEAAHGQLHYCHPDRGGSAEEEEEETEADRLRRSAYPGAGALRRAHGHVTRGC